VLAQQQQQQVPVAGRMQQGKLLARLSVGAEL
jgi:hypothetical protein